MADERLQLVIQNPVRYNEHLPGNQAFTLQQLHLTDAAQSPFVTVDAYLKPSRYYSVYWDTHTSPAALVDLTEEALKMYERQFPRGAPTIEGGTRAVSTPKVVELLWKTAAAARLDLAYTPNNLDRNGVILITQHPKIGGTRLALPLQRPLSWERFERLASRKPVSFARMNTRVGGFCISEGNDGRTFGVLSDLALIRPLLPLLELTPEQQVPAEDAMRLFDAVTALFAAREEKEVS